MILTTAEESRRLDRCAMEEFGLPEAVLMENAGASVIRLMQPEISWENARIVIVCGTGNNGGDGFVAARYASAAGAEVTVLLMGNVSHMGEVSLMYKNVIDKMGIPVIPISDAEEAEEYLSRADVIIDALIGTGLKNNVDEKKAALITCMNDSRALIISVDTPSGMLTDSGEAAGAVVNADFTVALGAVKRGHVLYPGSEYAGEVMYSPIGIPEEARTDYSVRITEKEDVYGFLPVRSRISHKGNHGFIGVFAGSEGMAGAGLLAAQGALYSGAGKIALATVEKTAGVLAGKVPEIMVSSCGKEPYFTKGMVSLCLKKAEDYQAIAIGPGLGRAEETQLFVKEFLSSVRKPVVVDADALFAVAEQKMDIKECPGQLILTPHVGEFARLTGRPAREIEACRIDAAIEFATANHVVLVLKGAPTVVAVPDGRAWINPTGNPGMASGGMGDTLTGIIAALLGQKMEAEEAAVAGVYLHGLAGDMLAETNPVGYTAGDLARQIPAARSRVMEA